MADQERQHPQIPLDPIQQQVQTYLDAHPDLKMRLQVEQQIDQTLTQVNANPTLESTSDDVRKKLIMQDAYSLFISDFNNLVGISSSEEEINELAIAFEELTRVWAENHPHNMLAVEEAFAKFRRGFENNSS